ncbi:hypothetical protein C1Y40_02669 [Mycobacterium talmoniae]|uniref:Uncharacterized protein n=1 Tax=Mycobacterium talmoniae TaxID=1858794 RepID=A0A2S8BKL5_9MYCO|nr:hypothetical protein C1Y40_02669 [Mycobacterium talmoniae]
MAWVVIAPHGRGVTEQRGEPVPGTVRAVSVVNTALPARCPLWPITSGRCWCSVPPSATLSTWAPRQMPSTGSPSRSAAASKANSHVSRRPPGSSVVGCRG